MSCSTSSHCRPLCDARALTLELDECSSLAALPATIGELKR